MNVLIDTSVLLALAFPKDSQHSVVRRAMSRLHTGRIVPVPVLPELFFLVNDRMGYDAAMNFFKLLQSPTFHIEVLTQADMKRMSQIMVEYRDNAFDFVDVAIMAVAERLNITHIYTLDRRHFSVFRPAHCAYFTLFP